MNLFAQLDRRAGEHPDRRAIVDARDGSTITYGQLRVRARRVSAQLRASGLVPGDRVLVGVPMSIDLYVVLLGLWHAGLAGVVPDLSSLKFLRVTTAAARAKGAVLAKRTAPAFALPEIFRIPKRFCTSAFPFTRRLETSDAVNASSENGIELDDAAPALVTFTSGSTGNPKTAVRSHGLLRAQMDAILANVKLGGTNLETMPIVLLANLAAGGTSVIPAVDLRKVGAADPAIVARAIDDHQCDTMISSPAVLASLNRRNAETGAVLPSLRRVYSGGAPVFPTLLGAFAKTAPNAAAIALYGSTEAEPIADLEHFEAGDEAAMRRGAGLLGGTPVPACRVRIVPAAWGTPLGPFSSEAFDALAAPPNVPGEIVVAGAHVLRGYDRGIGDDETKIHAGDDVWHRTGDLGFLDPAGRIWLLGRAGAVVEAAGARVYPLAVECAASYLEGVERSAFVRLGERNVLFVQLKAGAPLPAAAIAGVDDIQALADIPVDRRHNAKIDYPALRKLVGA